MESLEDFTEKQGGVSGHKAQMRYILKNKKARDIFLEIAKEAEEKNISDTIAAQYLVDKYDIFSHLHYNTVRRYFRDYRYGRIK